MHKIPNRQLQSGVAKRQGCVLENPLHNGDVLHHVYCSQNQMVYYLTKESYQAVIQTLNNNRRNDAMRMIDESLKFGDHIVFTHDEELRIIDFERGHKEEELFIEKGRDVFQTRSVFNPDLTHVFTETFGLVELRPDTFSDLSVVPTPNVELFCYFSYTLTPEDRLLPRLFRVLKANAADQSFVSEAPWNARKGTFDLSPDDEVELEKTIQQKVGALTAKTAFITGPTSVFIPELPHLTVLLPKHYKCGNYCGREARVDCIYNEVTDCYVVTEKKVMRSHYYSTLYTQMPSDVTAQFYVDIYSDDNKFGFYQDPHLNLIADPLGFLDVTKYFGNELPARQKHFIVPIRDRLGGIHDTRHIAKLGMITRFELVGIGERQSQHRVIESIKKSVDLKSGGVVLDREVGLVYSKFFHGCTFYLPRDHGYKVGDAITFRASRIMDPDFVRPTFKITSHQPYKKTWTCDYKPGEGFIVEASFNDRLQCYESDMFGFIPPADREVRPRPTSRERFPYYVKAVINDGLYAQTALTAGRVYRLKKD